jgi:rhodanese-related sulfurtransferase
MRETLQLISPTAGAAPVVHISLDELRAQRASQPVTVVDIRSPDEFDAGHVDGAINIPLEALADRTGELPKDALIVTVCTKGGRRSERAAEQLRSCGFTSTRFLAGGTLGWMQSKSPEQEPPGE